MNSNQYLEERKRINFSANLLTIASITAYIAVILKAATFFFYLMGGEIVILNTISNVALVFVVSTFVYSYINTTKLPGKKIIWYVLFWILSTMSLLCCFWLA